MVKLNFKFKKLPRIRPLKPKELLGRIKAGVKKHPKISLSVLIFWLLFTVAGLTVLKDLPSPTKLESKDFPVSTQIFDRNGQLLYEIYTDTHRTPVKLASLPAYVSQASIAIEDQDFYHHFGFSLQGMLRASKNTLFKNKLQGGSTITQQLVKTTLLTPERTVKRKIREAVLTLATEIIYSKTHILELYLNHIPYGGTAYGIEAAAQKFFNKPAKDLNLSEAALLAGLPQAPSRYSPFSNPEQAKARQYEVLRRMAEDGYIKEAEVDQAFAAPLNYAPPATNIKAPHFVFYIKDLIEQKYGLQAVERGGLRVITSLDLGLQEYAQSSVSAEIEGLTKYRVSNGAALVTSPQTGEVLAMVGSKDYFATEEDGQVNLTTRLRQPGSSIKPLNYVTALQTKKLHPGSMLLDIPTCFGVPGQPPYCPKNYDGSFHGPVQFRYALANSYNIPAVKILALNGLETMIATASAMGITTFTDPSRYGLSLTLGGGEVLMIDMATAFGTLANQGVKVPLHPILKITDYQGAVLEEYNPETNREAIKFFYDESNPNSNTLGVERNGLTRVLNREPSWLIGNILSDNSARTAAFGPSSKLVIKNKHVSVKTGTTNDLRDNWTIGYTPQFVVLSWVGNNDNSPMNPYVVSGVTGATPIWNSLMTHLLQNVEADATKQPEPPNIENVAVCNLTGTLPAGDNPCESRQEYVWSESLPKAAAAIKKNIWINKATGYPAFVGSAIGETLPAEEQNLDNLELQEHLVISDPFTVDFCLDCIPVAPVENPDDPNAKPQPYPRTIVDMLTFDPDGYEHIEE